MALSDWQFSLNSFTFSGPGSAFMITSVEGLGAPNKRAQDIERGSHHGHLVGYDTFDRRIITISMYIKGTDSTTTRSYARQLMQAWQPVNPLYPQDIQMNFKLPGANEMIVNGRPRRFDFGKMDRFKNNLIECTLEFVCLDPRIYDATYQSVTVTRGAGYISCPNAGTAPVWPTLSFNGPLTNPTLNNSSTGETLVYNGTLPSQDQFSVFTDTGLSGSGWAGLRAAGSRFPQLIPGTNSLALTDSSNSSGYVVVTYANAYWGI